jgi:hypothetical protein
VVLLRPSSFKSTMIQMIGRGLRPVDPEEYPGVVKTDCVVLDFGYSTRLHGSLEQEVLLDGHEAAGGQSVGECPECGGKIPVGIIECPLCGHVRKRPPAEEDAPLTDFIMSEIDLLKRSSFKWCDLLGDDTALMASGFTAWAGIFFLHGRWYAVGGSRSEHPHLLAIGERAVCLAMADDWLNENESNGSAHKSRSWLDQPVTDKQLGCLPPNCRLDFGLSRYEASVLLTFQFHKPAIHSVVFGADATARQKASGFANAIPALTAANSFEVPF